MSESTERQIAPILPGNREDKICEDFMDAGFLGKLWFGIKIWFGFVLAFILIAAIIASGVGVIFIYRLVVEAMNFSRFD